jgi:hypothetical protein
MFLPERPQSVSLCVLWLCFGAALFLPPEPARAATTSPFVAISPADASRYHIDLARNYYASPEAELAARAGYEAALTALEAWR